VSRSLAGFLAFLLVLVVIGLLGTWYLGPNLVSLAFDEERRDAPYYLLSFAIDETAQAFEASFRGDLAELVVADGGRLLWQAKTVQVSEGRVEDEWQDVQLFEFPRGAELVGMLTSTGYRDIVDAHPGASRMLLGTSTAPDALAGNQAAVLSLVRVDPQREPVDSARRRLLGNLSAYEGTMIWDAEVVDLEHRWPWNRVMLLAFPAVVQAEGWLRDPGTVTERALAGTAAKQRATLVMQSGS
jgi:uncharacterized protein (DUF1330 family)